MGGVLMLNSSYQPLKIVPLGRAMRLVVAEKAEVVQADGVIRSVSASFPRPAVIRLIRFVKVPYRAKLPLNRKAVLARDNGRCAYCGKAATTIDHVVPRSRGGAHDWLNVVAACSPCNAKKDDKTLKQLGWKLDFTPFAPKGTRWLILGIAEVDPSWEPYLAMA